MKKWYLSKILWVNTIALIALYAQAITGEEVLTAEVQTAILAMANFILRIVTHEGIE